MAVRFIREAWVLLSSGAGDVICCKVELGPVRAALSFGAEGG